MSQSLVQWILLQNGEIKWNKIRTNISLYNDNTIIIDFDPNEFVGQPVYRIVE